MKVRHEGRVFLVVPRAVRIYCILLSQDLRILATSICPQVPLRQVPNRKLTGDMQDIRSIINSLDSESGRHILDSETRAEKI